jgi:nicotinamidase-related amidase
MSSAALLVMDVQEAIVRRFGDPQGYLQRLDLAISAVVLADCCVDADPEVHRVLTGKVFPRQADVMTVEQWTSSLP